MRCTDKLITATAFVAVAALTAGCGTHTGTAGQSEAYAEALPQVQAPPADNVSRNESFETLAQLQQSSEVVVVAQAGAARKHPTSASKTERPLSFLDVDFTIDRALMGDLKDTITVFAEGPGKFKEGQTYLLFLRRLFPDQDTYAVTGYLAGMYQQVELAGKELAFGRVDPESQRLPLGLEVTGYDTDHLIALG
jgi:hypothetical protein